MNVCSKDFVRTFVGMYTYLILRYPCIQKNAGYALNLNLKACIKHGISLKSAKAFEESH